MYIYMCTMVILYDIISLFCSTIPPRIKRLDDFEMVICIPSFSSGPCCSSWNMRRVKTFHSHIKSSRSRWATCEMLGLKLCPSNPFLWTFEQGEYILRHSKMWSVEHNPKAGAHLTNRDVSCMAGCEVQTKLYTLHWNTLGQCEQGYQVP